MKFVARVIQDVDNLHYHDIANVLNFEQAEMLHEIHLAFKLAKSAEFSNKDLASALDHYERTKELFVENANLYDPLKHRVVAGLAQSLLKANVEYVHSA